MRRVLRAVLLLLVVLALCAGGAFLYGRHIYQQPGPLPEARNVVVPRGGLDAVGQALQQAGIIDRPLAFRLAAIATSMQGPLHAAELAFPQGASLQQVLAVLRFARPVQHHVTIPEGLTAAQIAELLDQAPALTGPSVLPAEGQILPDTYAYEYGTTREALIARATSAMQKVLAREWAGRDPDLPLATAQEAVILASIVERETGKPDERPEVAAVFLNRLKLGMKLQADPTVAYSAAGGLGPLDRKLTRADIDRVDPYNTYQIQGLPPAPICSPGLASLRAVLHPARTDVLYFVADGTGGHVFAHTLEEHLKNVDHYRSLTATPANHS